MSHDALLKARNIFLSAATVALSATSRQVAGDTVDGADCRYAPRGLTARGGLGTPGRRSSTGS